MENNIKVTVHRGTHQIGGCRTEVATKNLIDIAGENCFMVHSSDHVVLQDLNDMINPRTGKENKPLYRC